MGIAQKPLNTISDSEQSFVEMLDQHRRPITYMGVALIVIAGGTWLYLRSTFHSQRAAR